MAATEKPTLMLIDGHSLAFRAFFALIQRGGFTTRDGQHTEAVHGFISMLLRLIKDESPTHLGIAFDISRYSFRTREYEGYKDGRGETPPEFIGQVPLLQEALDAMRIRWLVKEDYEADDILATLATRGRDDGFRVLVVSGDRDTFQLIDDDVTVLYPASLGVSELKRYDADAVREKYGVSPAQYPELAALVGEKADNLPGITKVGPVTAAKWIARWGTVDEIVAHADEVTGVVGERLRAEAEHALRNRRLNELVRDLDLPYAPADLARRPVDSAALRDVFRRLEFNTLLDRVLKTLPADDGDESRAADDRVPTPPPARTLVDEELAHWLQQRGSAPAGIRVPQLPDAVEGVGIAVDDDAAWVPWGEHRPDYAPLARWLSETATTIHCGAKRDLHALHRVGLEAGTVAGDAAIAAWVLEPWSKGDELAPIVARFLGERLPVDDPSQLLPAETAPGPAGEAWYALRAERAIAARLDDGSASVYRGIEVPLIPVLARMEEHGIAVSKSQLTALRGELAAQSAAIAERAFQEIGREVNLASPKQLQSVLFDDLGMPPTRRTQTGYSTDADALADLQASNPHPFLDLLLQHRESTKLGSMVETLVAAVASDGRIHTTYDQTGAATGRLASSDPNLQNIPARTDVGRRIRAAFRADDGYATLLTADYSQIEMRIMAHLSGDTALIEAFNSGEDLHRFVGSRIFEVAPEDVTAEQRVKVKAMSYGLVYGLSAFGLAKQLRIDQREAKVLMEDYFQRFGRVRDYLREAVEQARIDGYTTTMFGRRRPLPELASSNRVARDNAARAALNAPIQGAAADIIKRAMIAIDRILIEGGLDSRMLLQVHDELVFEVAPGELDTLRDIVVAEMEGAASLSVPLEVQVGVGPDWDAAGH